MCLKEYGFVVGSSSPSGGGKTTVVSKVAEVLRDAVVITFDDYDGSNMHPTSYRHWLAEGADYNAWHTPRLAEDLKRLKHKQEIISPIDGKKVWPASYILFDAPLGRAHGETGQYIDLMVYLDTPLDIAMARRILRDFYGGTSILSGQEAELLRRELESYLEVSRAAYLELDKQVKPKSDLILDGTLKPEELVIRIVEGINAQGSKVRVNA
jgi:uridine kinase